MFAASVCWVKAVQYNVLTIRAAIWSSLRQWKGWSTFRSAMSACKQPQTATSVNVHNGRPQRSPSRHSLLPSLNNNNNTHLYSLLADAQQNRDAPNRG